MRENKRVVLSDKYLHEAMPWAENRIRKPQDPGQFKTLDMVIWWVFLVTVGVAWYFAASWVGLV